MTLEFRTATESDVPEMARLRAAEWGDEAYWRARIAGYMAGEIDPQHALRLRVVLVAVQDRVLTGFVAGHLTRRYECDGEVEWINVNASTRESGVASELLRQLARWFVANGARRVCVDVAPDNVAARRFYTKHGAADLNPHWMVWDDIGVVLG